MSEEASSHTSTPCVCPNCGKTVIPASYNKWRYHNDPEYRKEAIQKTTKYLKERRQNDAEFDAKIKEQWREHARKTAEKRAKDPELMEKRREYVRQYNLRKKMEKQSVVILPVS